MTAAKKRRKPRYRHMRFRKGDPVHNLLAAVQHYVKAHGGELGSRSSARISRAVGCIGKLPEPLAKGPAT